MASKLTLCPRLEEDRLDMLSTSSGVWVSTAVEVESGRSEGLCDSCSRADLELPSGVIFQSFEFCMSSIGACAATPTISRSQRCARATGPAGSNRTQPLALPINEEKLYSNREKDVHGNSQNGRLQDVESVLAGG